jgi:putative nucleotidyltransferase with HDIG domain
MATATEVKLEQLPVLPAVVVRLMGLAPSSEGYFEEVLSISSEDPGLAVRVIHAANSALSAPRQPIETLQGAIARLGATHIGNLVATLAVTQVFEPKTRGEVDLWVHAVEVAACCRLIAANVPFGVDQHSAYLCGLLHDIGRFVLFEQAGDSLPGVDDLGWDPPGALIAAEHRVFASDHAEIGHRLCTKWSIPKRIAAVVRDHHHPLELRPPVPAEDRLVAVVEMADRLSVLARTGALAGLEGDRPALSALIRETCVDPAWPAPPVSPEIVAGLVPAMQQAARLASEHLGLETA